MAGGYQNKILRVDLTNRKITEESLNEELIHDYIGGRGFGVKLLYDELKPGTDPLGEDNEMGPCGLFEDGQEFIQEDWRPPEGFCPWAWADIHKEIILVRRGGSQGGPMQEGTAIACCTDGFKPVVFRIERVED